MIKWLKNDPAVWCSLVVLALFAVVYTSPALAASELEAFAGAYAELFLLALVLFALVSGLERVEHREERRFWTLLALSFGLWALGTLTELAYPAGSKVGAMASDGLSFLSLLAFIVSAELQPHLRSGWSADSLSYRFSTIGSIVFAGGLLAYLFVIPESLTQQGYDAWGVTYYALLALDLLLTARFFYLSRTCASRRWGLLYGLLALAASLWLITDGIDCLVALQTVEVSLGTPLDFLWYLPFLIVVVTARLRHVPTLETAQPEMPGAEAAALEESRGIPALLAIYALALPVAHFGLYAAGLLDPASRQGRELAVVTLLLIFAALIVIQQKLLERRNRELRVALTRHVMNEDVQQSQKLEAIGRLAGGVAHDFNNLLMVIQGYSEVVLHHLAHNDPLFGKVEEIHKAAERAHSLTRQLLAFSRKQVLEPRTLELNSVILESEAMLQRLIGEDTELSTHLADDLGHVRADPGQILQVLLNLAINAREAMPGGGKLRIETANRNVSEADASAGSPVAPGRYVVLGVSDTGSGMDTETQSKIFDPFFTTKRRGTGLGMTTVHGIVTQSDGQIVVSSDVGRGTSFQIYLPLVAEPAVPVPEPKRAAASPRVRHATILLVEDEPAVRRITRERLRGRGFRVLEANNGAHALEVLEQHDGSIELLLTDVVMPIMGGGQLAERMKRLLPDLKILYMSGYADDAHLQEAGLDRDAAFIQKPFSWEALDDKLDEVLGPAREQTG